MAALSLASLLLLCLHPGNSIVENFFVRIGDDKQRYDGHVLLTKTLSTVIECSTECLRLPLCASYNARKLTTGQYECTMLKDIPVNPKTQLTSVVNTQYIEKTCQVLFNPTMATEYERENGTGIDSYTPLKLYIAGHDGKVAYVVKMTADYDISSIDFDATVHEKTGGSFDKIIGVARVYFNHPNSFQVFVTEGGIRCVKETSSGKVPCFSEPMVSKIALFGTEDVNALLATPYFEGLYVFGNEEVRVVDVPEFGVWTVNDTIHLSSTTRPPGWTYVPQGVVAAAWLIEYGGNPIFEKAFLLTRHFYVVYDFANDKILKRGHLCV